eukprot:scaffold62041_cov69-Phaeocystis_antarctica.AAC.2
MDAFFGQFTPGRKNPAEELYIDRYRRTLRLEIQCSEPFVPVPQFTMHRSRAALIDEQAPRPRQH